VAADAKVGSELIKVTAVDHDIGNNSVITYLIVTIQYIRLQSNETEDMGDIFLIGTHAPAHRSWHTCVIWDPALTLLCYVIAGTEHGQETQTLQEAESSLCFLLHYGPE